MTTINKKEIQSFKLADEWWDVNGRAKPYICLILSELNMFRRNYKHFKLDRKTKFPLKNLNS